MEELSILTPEEEFRAYRREVCKRYREKNREALRQAGRIYQKANKPKYAEATKRWRAKNPDKIKEYRLDRKQKAIDLLGGKCKNCASTEQLEFDHIKRDRVDKKKVITYMIISSKWSETLEELKKCQLLCVTCHMKKSHAERGRTGLYKHGTSNKYGIDKCRCDECRRYQSLYMKQWRKRQKVAIV